MGSESETDQPRNWVVRILQPLARMFRQGTDPARMAESIGFGTFLGILPLPGLNSILCAAVALRRGLNMGAIQAVNWLMLPVQIGLFLPLSVLGARIIGHTPPPLHAEDVRALLNAGPATFFGRIGLGFLDAVLAWLILGIPLCFLLLRLTRFILEHRARRR